MYWNRSRPESTDLTRHRSRIARVLLVGFAGLGLIAYVPSMWLSVSVGAWSIAVLDTVVYLALLAVLAFGAGRYRLEAGVVVGVCFVLGLALSALLGPTGAGPLWLMATPIVAAILFERDVALAALGAVTLTALAITALAVMDVLPWGSHAVATPVLWVVVAANALLLAGALTLAVARLIHGLREEMTERQRAESQLRQSEKLQAIGTLAAGIAHDFNNLLTPILSGTELARTDASEGSAPRQALDQAIDAAVAGRELVRRILAFSRPSAEGRIAMRADDAFRDAVRLLRATVPGSVSVVAQLQSDGMIRLSPTEVHQVVLNLGTNALKAMPGGGSLTFRLSTLPGSAVAWTTAAPRPARVVQLEVSDTGCGMTGDVVARIFEPFFTTDPHVGTGMGLATVHGIIASAGGQIGCRSRPGEGTTFTLDLPETGTDADERQYTGAAVQAALAATPLAGHVLVVDDERAVRDVAARVLERSGFLVTSAADAEAALEELRRVGPCDVVLSDLNMPGLSGLQLAERVRQHDARIGIVLMSGMVDESLLERARDAGVAHVVAKPFRVQELLEAVRSALAPA